MDIASIVTIISIFGWVAAVGLLVFFVYQASRGKPVARSGLFVLIAALVAIAFSTISAGLVFIDPDQRGVVISAVAPKGYREIALLPGLHWVIPFAETVVQYPISRQTYTMSIAPIEGQVQGDDSITARTSDGQEYMWMPLSFLPSTLNRWSKYISCGRTGMKMNWYGLRHVESSGMWFRSTPFWKSSPPSALRWQMPCAPQWEKKLSDNGLSLIDFILRNITFSPEYAASVEQKQIAEQTAQQAKLIVEQKRQEAEQARQVAQGSADAAVIASKGAAEARVIQAQAEAQSLELISKVLQANPNLLTYQYITKLSPSIQTMLLPSNSPFVFQLPNMDGQLTTP